MSETNLSNNIDMATETTCVDLEPPVESETKNLKELEDWMSNVLNSDASGPYRCSVYLSDYLDERVLNQVKTNSAKDCSLLGCIKYRGPYDAYPSDVSIRKFNSWLEKYPVFKQRWDTVEAFLDEVNRIMSRSRYILGKADNVTETTEITNIEPPIESEMEDITEPKTAKSNSKRSSKRNKTESKNAEMSNRELREIDYLPYPGNIKLYIDGDNDKMWAISVGYNYEGQYVNAADSRVYRLIHYKGTQAMSGALTIDKSQLDLTFDKVRANVQKYYAEGKAYDYKNYLPITMFARKQGSQCGGIIELQDGDGAVKDILHRRYDYKQYYYGDFADEIWNISNISSVRKGRIIKNRIKAFTNDPNENALMLCIIDKYLNGQLFVEEDMLERYKTPAWDEWMDKFDKQSQEYIMAWIWTLVYQNANNSEILWIRSEGGDGKTTFVNALKSGFEKIIIFGNNDFDEHTTPFCADITNSNSDGLKDKFLPGRIYDKRLVYVPECKNPNILRSSIIHQLTGGESMSAEQKFEKAFTVKPQANVLICSNDYPNVDNQRNELRRLLFVSPREDYVHKEIKDDTFEKRLSAELDTLLYKCKFYYDRCIKRGKGYIQPPSETLDWIQERGVMPSSNDHNYNLLFTEGDDTDKLTYQDIQNTMNIRNQELRGKIKFVFDQRAIQVYFRETFNITRMGSSKRIVGGKTAKAFVGVKMNDSITIEGMIDPVKEQLVFDSMNFDDLLNNHS